MRLPLILPTVHLLSDKTMLLLLFICKTSSDMRTSRHLPPSAMGVNFIHITANRDSSSTIGYMSEREHEGEVIIVDGSAMVNTTPPRTSKTFEDYAREDILPKIKFYGATYKIVDVVFVVYRKSTLKGEARMRRGQGMRRRVTCTSETPTNWRSFLRDADNKTELFQLLADIILANTDNHHTPCDERRMRHLQ